MRVDDDGAKRPMQLQRTFLISAAALAIGGLLAAGSLLASPTAEAGDEDCSDFDTQNEAQNFFESHNPSQDPHNLDGDGDGKACETLPCPCADDGAGGGGGGGGGNPGGGGGGSHKPNLKKKARVAEVTDGDTLAVRLKGGERDVRVIGIDTPEVFFGEECGGAEASASMKGLLDPGDRVTLVRDRSQDGMDDFGRLLRYVERGSKDIGRAQIARGWAEVFVFEDPFKRVRSYRKAENSAETADAGVWGKCGGDFHKPL